MRLAEGCSSETSLGLCRGQAALFLLPGARPTPKLLLLQLQSSLLYQSPTQALLISHNHFWSLVHYSIYTTSGLWYAAATAAAAAEAFIRALHVHMLECSRARLCMARVLCRRHSEQHGDIASVKALITA